MGGAPPQRLPDSAIAENSIWQRHRHDNDKKQVRDASGEDGLTTVSDTLPMPPILPTGARQDTNIQSHRASKADKNDADNGLEAYTDSTATIEITSTGNRCGSCTLHEHPNRRRVDGVVSPALCGTWRVFFFGKC